LAGLFLASLFLISKNYQVFSISSIIVFSLLYLRINPAMERYWTNLIPFMILPIGVGIQKVLDHFDQIGDRSEGEIAQIKDPSPKRSTLLRSVGMGIGLVGILLMQGYQSYQGLHQ